MFSQLELRVLKKNCANCKYLGHTKTVAGDRIAICTNNNSKEFRNQVDKYVHCPWHKQRQ